jgi:hypothetical protein
MSARKYSMLYCIYYQAKVLPSEVWFLVAALRSCEHLVFDRTLDTKTSTFEFFVPPDLEPFFLHLIQYFVEKNCI